MVLRAREMMLVGMSLISDEPSPLRLFFDFKARAKRVSVLLKSDRTPTPFTIAIHGEWGSGKTTLLNLIEKNLDGVEVIRFNAWEYERSNVVASLMKLVEKKFNKEGQLKKHILSLVMDVVARKAVGMTLDDVVAHFDSAHDTATSAREELEGIVTKKLVILIDDLDRCTADNVLSVLEAVKMFFNVKNVIVVMAIDMEKVERAWELRYNSSVGKIEGREHAEKMFALKLSLPPKPQEQLAEFVKHHAVSLNETDIDFMLNNTQPNPRKIKRMLNLLYVILQDMPDRGSTDQEIDANFKSDLKMVIAWIALTLNHPHMARKIQQDSDLLITAAVICHKVENRGGLLELIREVDENPTKEVWTGSHISVHARVLTPDVYDLLRNIADEQPSFTIVIHVADQFDINANLRDPGCMNLYRGPCDQLKSIMGRSGMVGV